jgi:hypothetical protein
LMLAQGHNKANDIAILLQYQRQMPRPKTLQNQQTSGM